MKEFLSHILTKHLNAKENPCYECNLKDDRIKRLSAHVRKITKVRNLTDCDAKVIEKRSFKKHITTVHEGLP